MCSSKSKLQEQQNSKMNGRSVLQPNCVNRTPLLERCNSIPLVKNSSSPTMRTAATNAADCSSRVHRPLTFPSSPRTVLPPPILNDTSDDQPIPAATPPAKSLHLNKSKSFKHAFSSSILDYAPAGSIAAARREQVAILQEQRKMRIAHYGRTAKSKIDRDQHSSSLHNHSSNAGLQEKRCTFITANSDPIYVAYHDEEWGVPLHDDELLFELLVLTGAQVGSDWTSVLRKRQDFRDAFSRFDVEIASKYSEKKMISISAEYCIELSLVRAVVDNSKRILEIKKGFGSLDRYLWGFVNHKPIATQYKWCHKIPVKTSKSETISKDMVRRGFRLVGPTVIHSFMQAAGLTNNHLITCPRHSQCLALLPSSNTTSVAS